MTFPSNTIHNATQVIALGFISSWVVRKPPHPSVCLSEHVMRIRGGCWPKYVLCEMLEEIDRGVVD